MLQIVNKIHVKCACCGGVLSIEPDVFDFQTYTQERQMGPEIGYYYEEQFECRRCHNIIGLELTGNEYPAGAFNFSNAKCDSGEIIDEPSWEIVDDFVAPYDDEFESCKERIQDMTPREFEMFVGEMLRHMGFSVRITQQTRDGGFDVLAESVGQPFPITMLAECKHYQHPVGVSVIRSAYGVLEDREANLVAVVTSSRFSGPAREFAERHGNRINLIDIDFLANQLYQMNWEY